MCGIIGRVGRDPAIDTLLTGLENLEYRGYDSAGVAVQNGAGIQVQKRSGEVADLKRSIDRGEFYGSIGIGHTRWSTHGPPTDANAHPHTNQHRDVAVVHNGIIENYTELRERLRAAGHAFSSETDTEVIPHLLWHYLADGLESIAAFRETVDDLEGSYAIAAMRSGEKVLYAARQGSPLVIGLDDDGAYLASDVPAFLEYTDDVVYLEDGDIARVSTEGIEVSRLDGTAVEREPTTVGWDPTQVDRGEFDHFMLKEIHEQPTALRQTLAGRISPESGRAHLEEVDPSRLADVASVQFVGCGTSYHAALYAAIDLRTAGIPANAILANEYAVAAPPVDSDTLVVAVTQSGETADTLAAIRSARAQGARTVTLTNVAGSTAARIADDTILIRAGPEIGVAATKTFSSQVVVLTLLTDTIAGREENRELLEDLAEMDTALERVLETSEASSVAANHHGSHAYFFIGRGRGYPVALEGALKFKEITYEHAEGFAAGELKHGPLALVTEETPVFVVFTGRNDERTLANAREATTRGAPVVAICPPEHEARDIATSTLTIPSVDHRLSGLFANVQLQLLAYHAARLLDRSIDKPRNLAKSVTVE